MGSGGVSEAPPAGSGETQLKTHFSECLAAKTLLVAAILTIFVYKRNVNWQPGQNTTVASARCYFFSGFVMDNGAFFPLPLWSRCLH